MSNAVASSSKHKSKKTPKVKETPSELSKETVDTDSDDSKETSEVDSEDDIDTITPKKKPAPIPSTTPSRSNKSLPKYAPPQGMTEISIKPEFTTSPFTYESLSNPNLELWCIRVPQDFKPSRLSNLSISLPTKSSKSRPEIKGSLKTKHTTYDLVPIVAHSGGKEVIDEDGRHTISGPGLVDAMTMDVEVHNQEAGLRGEGGEEMMGGMRLLVPRVEADGKLFVAPIPIKHHLLLTPQSLPTPNSTTSHPLPSYLSTTIPSQTTTTSTLHPDQVLPSKRVQPVHLMKFRNKVYGFDTPGPEVVGDKVTDAEKGVKRKSEVNGETPKKKAKSG